MNKELLKETINLIEDLFEIADEAILSDDQLEKFNELVETKHLVLLELVKLL